MRGSKNDDVLGVRLKIGLFFLALLLTFTKTTNADDPRLVIQTGHLEHVYCIAFSFDGKLLASGGVDKFINLWDVDTGIILKTLKGHDGWVDSLAFSPDGKKLASGSYDKSVKIWDVESGNVLKTYGGHSGTVSSVAFTPDGNKLISSSHDKSIRLWDNSTGQQLLNIPLQCSTLNANGNKCVAANFDETGKQIKSFSLWDIDCIKPKTSLLILI